MAQEPGPLPHHPRAASEADGAVGLVPSHGISINLPPTMSDHAPHPVRHMSAPAYQSPIRHHRRAPSRSKGVKETLNARSHYGSSDDDGSAVHRINQYIIKQEIGRGSFGAVHLAVDQYGNEFAVKEFSKSRLRKRAQSNLLRQPDQRRRPGQLAAGLGFNSPLHRLSSSDKLNQEEQNNSLNLIKEEIAIMKKLDHNNLCCLIEVLDDPQEDSLYMVVEMCKKGVVMKVGLEERAEPYESEACRCWFRDMILGIEYLHAQGIIHRDIKPDNCLITQDDILKIVDFGVSEMFEKQSDMATAKSAGSPAFMPPELCVAKHGQVRGRAADIWSMGVTLYCLRYGHIPFEKHGMLELYESIRGDDVPLDEEPDQNFVDLMRRLLEKDPEKRITMDELRDHPWVTKGGTDPLLSAEENCADLIEPPTEAEMENAITGNMAHLLAVMRAVKRFKELLGRKRPQMMEGMFGRNSRIVSPPHEMSGSSDIRQSRSTETHDRKAMDSVMVTEGVHRPIDVDEHLHKLPSSIDTVAVSSPESTEKVAGPQQRGGEARKDGETDAHLAQRLETDHHPPRSNPNEHCHPSHRSYTFPEADHGKGHAHDPLDDAVFLDIGPSADATDDAGDKDHAMVSESPPAIEMNIYEQAYQEEMKRILEERGDSASMYLTRRMDHRDDLRSHSNILDGARYAGNKLASKFGALTGRSGGGLANLAKQTKLQQDASSSKQSELDASKREQNAADGVTDERSTDDQAQADAADVVQTQPLRHGDVSGERIDTDVSTLSLDPETLNAHKGAMPGMAGGFPRTPEPESQSS